MDKKKIEPTDAMVEAALFQRPLTLGMIRAILRDVLNHPDAPGLFADEDDRPWEPLSKGDPLNVGDEVRRERAGITVTAVVGRVDGGGNLWTIEGGLLIHSESGTWHVRRAAQELPTKPGSVIVPADGCDYIESTLWGETFYARAALRSWTGWYAAWRAGGRKCGLASSGEITPGTWKVADQ